MAIQKMKLRTSIFSKIKNEDRIIIIIVIILILTYGLLKIFSEKSKTILMEYAKNKSIEISTLIINESMKETIVSENINDILKITKNQNNEIIEVSFDNVVTNKILQNLNASLLKNTLKLEENNGSYKSIIYNVPFNVLSEKTVLIGIGPKIPFKLEIISSSNNNITTNVKEYGINNSLIELLLEIELNVQIILPFVSERTVIKKNIPIGTKIIQGKIPEYYGGMISART